MSGGGRVIVFEGVDGAGKSTVLELVAARLREAGVRVCTPRVGKRHASKPAREIRRLTRERSNLELRPRAELLLYAAREAQVLDEDVRPALARGDTVLLDRSLLTAVVIGAFGRGLELELCEGVSAAAASTRPDLTLIFDADPRTSRVRKRIDKIRSDGWRRGGRKGLSGSGFKQRIRAGYLALARRDGLPVLHTERSSAQELAAAVVSLIEHGRFDEPADASRPWWIVDPSASFEQALSGLPPLLQLYFGARSLLGRAHRATWLEREPALAIWCADLDDPLLERAASSEPVRVLARLSGSRSNQAELLRRQLATTHPTEVARSLVGVAGSDADRLRERLVDAAPGAVLDSLAGRGDHFATELRARLWAQGNIHERALSLRGCDDAEAWRARAALLEEDPAVLIETLAGLAPARVDPILERFGELAPKAVLRALRGRADDRAHALRRELLETGWEVVDSLLGLDDREAWALRERCVERWPASVAWSLAGLADRPGASALLEQCRRAAPEDLLLGRWLHELDAGTPAPVLATALGGTSQ